VSAALHVLAAKEKEDRPVAIGRGRDEKAGAGTLTAGTHIKLCACSTAKGGERRSIYRV